MPNRAINGGFEEAAPDGPHHDQVEADRGRSQSPESHPSPWLTVKEAADYASLSTDTIYTGCESGELRHARVRAVAQSVCVPSGLMLG